MLILLCCVMKRQDRGISPRISKRSRAVNVASDLEMERQRLSPDLDRRSNRKLVVGVREAKPYRDYDEYDTEPPHKIFREDRIPEEVYSVPFVCDNGYRSLCVTNITSKLSDADVREAILSEFWKFGEMNVKIAFSGDQRVCYINFRYPEDARNAKHKGRIDMFDRPIRLDPVYNKKRSGSPGDYPIRDHYAFHNRRSSPLPYLPPPFPHLPHGPPVARHSLPIVSARGHPHPPPFQPGRSHLIFSSPPPPMPIIESEVMNKNDKFPYHLDHIDPEFDEKATRTLFIGNLDVSISDIDLKHIFEKYGYVEDVDIKLPQKGQGNAYAFIKFINLDCAHRAKVEMSGKYIGKFQCKIGYGKVTPTTCLWVGGLGPWVSKETVEHEFDRFGVITDIEWTPSKFFAYVLYDSIDAAKAACKEMRGYPLGGSDRRIRVDFADASHMNNPVFHAVMPPCDGYSIPERDMDRGMPWSVVSSNGRVERIHHREDWMRSIDPQVYRYPREEYVEESRQHKDWAEYPDDKERKQRAKSSGEYLGVTLFARHSRSPEKPENVVKKGTREDGHISISHGDLFNKDNRDTKLRNDHSDAEAEMIRNLIDFSKNLQVAWNGALILKNSAFAARMHVVSGDVAIVDTLMRDPTSTEAPVLRITQRLRLDQPKLEDVGRRIANSGSHGHCVLLAMPSTVYNIDEQMGVNQQRPLKNLVSYLKQKEAAGVISLPPNQTSNKPVGVLHAFPPCQFGYNFLLKHTPKLPPDFLSVKDDYLVIVVVAGAN